MNLTGILIGAATFLTIGVFHPLVIKAEYHLGTGSWWIFLLVGLGALQARCSPPECGAYCSA